MYKYEFVHIVCKNSMTKATFQEHREIIEKYANDGYRFVGMIPVTEKGYGYLAEMDLVFEKEDK